MLPRNPPRHDPVPAIPGHRADVTVYGTRAAQPPATLKKLRMPVATLAADCRRALELHVFWAAFLLGTQGHGGRIP